MDRLTRSAAPFGIALIPWLWMLAPMLFANKMYLSPDLKSATTDYPLHYLLATSLHTGRLPLWTNQVANGFPIFADGAMGGMHPLNLFLFRYLDPFNAYRAALALSVLLTLVASGVYFRNRLHSPEASAIGAMAFTFSASSLIHLDRLSDIEALPMLPLVLLFTEQFLNQRRVSYGLLVGVCLAGAMVSGSNDLPVIISAALLLTSAFHLTAHPDPALWVGTRLPYLVRFPWWSVSTLLLSPVVYYVACLLAAPQLMSIDDLRQFSQWPDGLPLSEQPGVPLDPGLAYPGIIAALLAAFAAVLGLRNRLTVLSLFFIMLAMVLASGPEFPAWPIFRQILPGSAWMIDLRAFYLVGAIGVAQLAAQGFDTMHDGVHRRFATSQPHLVSLLVLALPTLLALDLGYHGTRKLDFMSADALLTSPFPLELLPKLGPYRLLSLPPPPLRTSGFPPSGPTPSPQDRETSLALLYSKIAYLQPNINMLHGVNVVGIESPHHPRGYSDLLTLLSTLMSQQGASPPVISSSVLNLMHFLGVRILLAPTELDADSIVQLETISPSHSDSLLMVHGIEDPHPKAYLARAIQPCAKDVMIARIQQGRFGNGWNPCRESAEHTTPPTEESVGIAGFARMDGRSEAAYEFTVELLNSGYLVVRESYFPGWTSFVDGLKVETVPVDLINRATPVPAGKHTVRQEFHPRAFTLGLGLNVLGLLAVGMGLVISYSQARTWRTASEHDRELGQTERWFQ